MIALISIKYLQCCGLDLAVGILTSEPKLELDMIVDIQYKGDYDKYLRNGRSEFNTVFLLVRLQQLYHIC